MSGRIRRRVLSWCLLAYPRERRRRDGVVLRDLALDLGDSHGITREAVSLVRAGVADRVASWSIGRRAAVGALVTGVIALAILPAMLPNAIGETRVDVDRFECAPEACTDTAGLVAMRRKDGWECRSMPSRRDDVVGWECSLR